MRRALSGDHLRSEHHLANALVFNDRKSCRHWINRLSIRIWVRYQKEVERISHRQSPARVAGLSILRGDGDVRIDLTTLSESHPDDTCVALTGIFLETTKPSDVILNQIRELLRPQDRDEAFVKGIIEAFAPHTTIVGVHVRHGDYRTWKDGIFYHPFEEYVQSMERMLDALPGETIFLIVSDEEQDMSLCPSSLNAHRIRGSEMQDLLLLSHCDYIIATHSSFANWASFFGRVPILTMRDAMKSNAIDPKSLNMVEFPRLTGDYLV
ncbi:Glycosyl transferase family 11 [Rubripirellula obstinata]|uniref:Glycosyl transferase family 11 n=1 Tax=Rubripirellula obstinata TaxID=406547 RepID=A0A5B1CK87_9BACT|nr:Glycosyl transferase family 11 [Rubripirellula obstinata]